MYVIFNSIAKAIMRPGTLVLLVVCFLLVILSSASPATVKLTLAIPEGHKVTYVNLRFEGEKSKTEGSFEGGAEDEDEEDERPSFGKGPGKMAGADKESHGGRQSKAVPKMVETFPVGERIAEGSYNTINKVIKLPGYNSSPIKK